MEAPSSEFTRDQMETLTQFGSYQIVRKIGAGGMADVYEAVRVGLENFQTRVALKCIQPAMTRDDRFVKMFVNEAHLGSQLHHPNIIQIQDFNKFQDTYYIAMEYVEGVDLSRIIKRLAARGLGFPATVVIDLSLQALAGLGHAHEARRLDGSPMNIIHRDVKPSNFLITASGMVKVGDFGIAKAANSTHNLSLTGDALKGTINYMSPEQIDGAVLTPASDLFGVVAIIFEMLTLRSLFDGPTMSSILLKIAMVNIESDMNLVANRYPIFVPLLRKGLARDPRDRYQNASAMAADLRRLREELGDGLSLREFLAMHLELFAPYGTQPGEQDEQDEALSMAVTPADGSQRPNLSADMGMDASVYDHFSPDSSPDIYFSPHEKTPPLQMGGLSEQALNTTGSFRLPQAPASVPAAPSWTMDMGSVAQDLLAGEDPMDAEPEADAFSSMPTHAMPGRATSQPVKAPEPLEAPPKRSIMPWVIAVAILVGIVVAVALPRMGILNTPAGTGVAATTGGGSADPGQNPAQEPSQSAAATGSGTAGTEAPAMTQAGQLSISSTPPNAHIAINGQPLAALTPTNIPLAPDQHSVQVTLSLPGYKPFTQELAYQKGQNLSIGPTLVPASASLTLTSTPVGARIFIDQKSTGQVTPVTIDNLPLDRPVRVALRLAGYSLFVQELTLAYDKPNKLEVSLEKGSEHSERPPVTPVQGSNAPQPPVATPKPEPVRPPRPVDPPDQETRPATTGAAALVLNTIPDDAEVYVDGSRKGQVPQSVKIGSGSHRIEFRAYSSGKRKEISVTLSPGEEKRVVWNIEEDKVLTRSTPSN